MRHHFGDFVFRHGAAQQFTFLAIVGADTGQLLLQFRYASVLQFRHAREVAGAARGFALQARAIQFFFDVLHAVHRGLFRLPYLFQIGIFLLQFVDLGFEGIQTPFRGVVGFFLEGLAFDLELYQATV